MKHDPETKREPKKMERVRDRPVLHDRNLWKEELRQGEVFQERKNSQHASPSKKGDCPSGNACCEDMIAVLFVKAACVSLWTVPKLQVVSARGFKTPDGQQ